MVVISANSRLCVAHLLPLHGGPVKPPKHPNVQFHVAQRSRHVAAGEGRSANRTKWSADTAASPPALVHTAKAKGTSASSAADLVRL